MMLTNGYLLCGKAVSAKGKVAAVRIALQAHAASCWFVHIPHHVLTGMFHFEHFWQVYCDFINELILLVHMKYSSFV